LSYLSWETQNSWVWSNQQPVRLSHKSHNSISWTIRESTPTAGKDNVSYVILIPNPAPEPQLKRIYKLIRIKKFLQQIFYPVNNVTFDLRCSCKKFHKRTQSRLVGMSKIKIRGGKSNPLKPQFDCDNFGCNIYNMSESDF